MSNLTERARAAINKAGVVAPVPDSYRPIEGPDEAAIEARLTKAFAGHTEEQIAALSWTDRANLAMGREIQWPNPTPTPPQPQPKRAAE